MNAEERQKMEDEKFESDVENLMNTLAELKTELSELRKKGKDPVIPEFMLRNVKSKIMYYKASHDKEDLLKIKKIFENVRKEIAEVKTAKELDIKVEVYAKAGIKLVKAEE